MFRKYLSIGFALGLPLTPAHADEVMHRYEGDVHPLDPSTGWVQGSPCEDPCTEYIEDGHFVFFWPVARGWASYGHWINVTWDPPPPSLWVEWRYRSNHPWDGIVSGCDGFFVVDYDYMHDGIAMYGDTAISFEGGDVVTGLDIDEFHTYRFESLDGFNYWVSVDGLVFMVSSGGSQNVNSYLHFGGHGGCISDNIPNKKQEWDFVRLGTISFGERIIASDRPAGYLEPCVYPELDRFTVTFDAPKYVYIDDITVDAIAEDVPEVIQTLRRETDDVDTIEIVLDRPIPMGATTRFTFNDGVAVNVIEYSLVAGDADGNGRIDLADFARFQLCMDVRTADPDCLQTCLCLFDADESGHIDLTDFADFHKAFTHPGGFHSPQLRRPHRGG